MDLPGAIVSVVAPVAAGVVKLQDGFFQGVSCPVAGAVPGCPAALSFQVRDGCLRQFPAAGLQEKLLQDFCVMERQAVQGCGVFFCLLSVVLRKAAGGLMREEVLLYGLGMDGEVVGAVEIGDELIDEGGMEGAALLPDVVFGEGQLAVCGEIGL